MQIRFSHQRLGFIFVLLLLIPFCAVLGQEFTLSEKIAARIAGPFHFRFLLQPLVAIILGIRDGKTDARLNRPPYIFEIFSNKQDRKENLNNAFKSIAKPLLIGIVLDCWRFVDWPSVCFGTWNSKSTCKDEIASSLSSV